MAYQVETMRAVIAELRGRGITVHEVDGWQTRGSINFAPRGLVCHHTGNGPGDYPTLGMILRGRPDLPPPLAQWGLGRSGDVWLIGVARANHAGRGGWRGLSGNTSVWGIEAESTGKGDWTNAQRRNYPVLAAALARHGGFGPEMICAHREWTPRKPDPAGIDMDQFRADVARHLTGQPSPRFEEDITMNGNLPPNSETFQALDGVALNARGRQAYLRVTARDRAAQVYIGGFDGAPGRPVDIPPFGDWAVQIPRTANALYIGSGPDNPEIGWVVTPSAA